MSMLAIGFVLSCRVGGSRRQTATNQGEEAWQACAKFIPGGVGPAGFCVIQGDEAVGDIRRRGDGFTGGQGGCGIKNLFVVYEGG